MKRRQFLTALPALTGLGLLWPARVALSRHALLIQRSPLAGFQYHHGRRLWPRLREGQLLHLVREPDNPYDHRAVRVDWRSYKLGYLPRRQNYTVAQMLDRGERLHACIAGLAVDNNPWKRIMLEVWR